MNDMINNLFLLKEQEDLWGKEIAKEVAKEFARKYKNDFAKGDNPIVALSLCCLIELIWQTAYSREIISFSSGLEKQYEVKENISNLEL